MAGDTPWMRRALLLARRAWGDTSPNPMVGAVLVRDGEVIGEGYHHRCGMPHAEVEAIRDALAKGNDPAGSTIYVTLEPCSTCGRTPACTDAILNAGISRVVIAALDPNPKHAGRGVAILRKGGVKVRCGVCRKEAEKLNQPFFHWITTGTPYVILKMAMTLDGKIATASGDSKWVTGPEARAEVQQLRRLADAILVGGDTARLDRPKLTVRDGNPVSRQPRRLVASRTLTETDLAEIFPEGDLPQIVQLPDPAAWRELLSRLGGENVMTLLLEGGGELAASALRAGVVNELYFYMAPKILGGRHSRPVVGGDDPQFLAEALEVAQWQVEPCGRDLRIRATFRKDDRACLQD